MQWRTDPDAVDKFRVEHRCSPITEGLATALNKFA